MGWLCMCSIYIYIYFFAISTSGFSSGIICMYGCMYVCISRGARGGCGDVIAM